MLLKNTLTIKDKWLLNNIKTTFYKFNGYFEHEMQRQKFMLLIIYENKICFLTNVIKNIA